MQLAEEQRAGTGHVDGLIGTCRHHDIAAALAELFTGLEATETQQEAAQELIEIARRYGHRAHVEFSYGREEEFKTPSEVVTPELARQSVADATRALELVAIIRDTEATEPL